jgi:hypothetical protein
MKSVCLVLHLVLSLPFAAIPGYDIHRGAGSTERGNTDVTEWIEPSSAAAATTPPEIFDLILSEDRAAIEKLIDSGQSLEVRDGFGATPVLAAALIDDWTMVEYFLLRGADPLVADRRGFTVAFLAQTSRVDLDGRYGQALARVRATLSARLPLGTALPPAQVKQLQQKGAWPPAIEGR